MTAGIKAPMDMSAELLALKLARHEAEIDNRPTNCLILRKGE